MALSILDGNQSATTLSTILTSGQHITAHTVVSLGTQAITDMRSAVSGSVVSISNFPATQTIAGTVTANVSSQDLYGQSATPSGSFLRSALYYEDLVGGGGEFVRVHTDSGGGLPIRTCETDLVNVVGTVTVGNSVTIGSLPAISGTVTANLPVTEAWAGIYDSGNDCIRIELANLNGDTISPSNPLPISGTVTVGNSVTIGSLPAISGTVTVGAVSTTVTIAHHQGTSVTTSNFTSTTASTTLASANASREVLTIFNEGAGNLHICAGATCTTIAYQVRLSAGDYYEVPLNQTSLTHSAVFATAGTARVTEIS